MILLLPAFVFLWLADDSDTALPRRVLAALLQIELMIDIPVRFRDFAVPEAELVSAVRARLAARA